MTWDNWVFILLGVVMGVLLASNVMFPRPNQAGRIVNTAPLDHQGLSVGDYCKSSDEYNKHFDEPIHGKIIELDGMMATVSSFDQPQSLSTEWLLPASALSESEKIRAWAKDGKICREFACPLQEEENGDWYCPVCREVVAVSIIPESGVNLTVTREPAIQLSDKEEENR